jgi:hypothetical protein
LTAATAIPNFFVVRNERREEDNMNNSGRAFDDNVYDLNVYDLNAILHPGAVYDHPRDVLADEELTLAEKRSILASWASDAAAITSYPSLRALPGQLQPVSIDDILEALSELDNGPRPPGGKPARRRSTSRISEAA